MCDRDKQKNRFMDREESQKFLSADCHRLHFHSSSVCLSSGLIKTALPGMDREVKENYQVVIQAKDMAGQMGGLSGTTTVRITLSDVNDNPPRFTKSESGLGYPPGGGAGPPSGVGFEMNVDYRASLLKATNN